ncbi:MAG: RHS repeat-associated core domain-containing protein, partial [Tepidisphaeraceae bacterium]
VDDQNVSTLKNRYLHGPGVDDVLAEEAVRDFTLSTTTVTLDGFGNPDLDGGRDVSLYPAGGPDYWYGTWSTGEMSMFRSAGGTGWEAYVYDYNNGVTIYFMNPGTSATPPTSGWSYQWDDWGMYPGAEIDAVASTTGTGWRTHWLLGDHQGSVRQVVDDAGVMKDKIDYDAFGNVTGTNANGEETRFGYTGQEWDAGTEMMYSGVRRYYDPGAGQWLTEDPAQDGTNWHAYVSNMPMDYTDPYGESAFPNGAASAIGTALGHAARGLGNVFGPMVSSIGGAVGGAVGGLFGGASGPNGWASLDTAGRATYGNDPNIYAAHKSGDVNRINQAWLESSQGSANRAQNAASFAAWDELNSGWQGALRTGLSIYQSANDPRVAAQAGVNVVQAAQNSVIGLANLSTRTSPVGGLLNTFGVNTTIPSPDWSKDLFANEYGGHNWSVGLAEVGLSLVTAKLPFVKGPAPSPPSAPMVGGNFSPIVSGAVEGSLAPWTRFNAAGAEKMAEVGRLGRAGERMAGIVGPKVGIRGPISGRMRFPDSLTRTLLREIKNVRRQGLTAQIKDYIAIAKREGVDFELFVRSTTRLSIPLQAARAAGDMIIRYIPGM